jgi:RNA-binding protein 8A
VSPLTNPQGYALIEYALKSEAEEAIKATDGSEFLEKTINT